MPSCSIFVANYNNLIVMVAVAALTLRCFCSLFLQKTLFSGFSSFLSFFCPVNSHSFNVYSLSETCNFFNTKLKLITYYHYDSLKSMP